MDGRTRFYRKLKRGAAKNGGRVRARVNQNQKRPKTHEELRTIDGVPTVVTVCGPARVDGLDQGADGQRLEAIRHRRARYLRRGHHTDSHE